MKRNKPLNILHVSTVPYGNNGITHVIKNMGKSLVKKPHYERIDFIFAGEVIHSQLENNLFTERNTTILNHRTRNPLKYFWSLWKNMTAKSYDIVHIHGNSRMMTGELIVAKLAGIKKRIVHSHSTSTIRPLLHRNLKGIFNCLYTDGVACSTPAGNWLFGKHPHQVVPNGIISEKFLFNQQQRTLKRNELNLSVEDFVIGHIGEFSKWKNQVYLIDLLPQILKNIPTTKLLLVGEGNLKKDLQAKVKTLGLEKSVVFLGNRNDIPSLLSAFDLLMMPSLFEGLPLTLIEAQVACLPALVSDTITDEVDFTQTLDYFSLSANSQQIIEKIQTHIGKDRWCIDEEALMNNPFDIKQTIKAIEAIYHQA